MTERPQYPLAMWLIIVAVVAGGTLAIMGVLIRGAIISRADNVKATAPGILDFQLSVAGTYYIFHEFNGTLDAKGVVRPPGMEKMSFVLQHMDSGARIEVKPMDKEIKYKFRRRKAEAVRFFDAESPGKYRLISEYPEANLTTPYDIAIGQAYGSRVINSLLQTAGILVAMTVFTIIAMIYGRRVAMARMGAA